MKGSIPPANRQPGRLSSMRAATHVGLTLVSAQYNHAASQATVDEFKPRVISPDGERVTRAELRSAYAKALAEKVAFWSAELATWAEEFGPSATKKLREAVDGRTDNL